MARSALRSRLIAYGETRERTTASTNCLPWQGCQVISTGEVFLMNWDTEDAWTAVAGPLPSHPSLRVVLIRIDGSDGTSNSRRSTR